MVHRTIKVLTIISAISVSFFFLFNYYLPSKIGAAGPSLIYRKLVKDTAPSKREIRQERNKVIEKSIADDLGIPRPQRVQYEPFDPKNIAKQKPEIRKIFNVPEEITTEVGFWRDIYTKYDKTKVVIHDKKYLGIVYSVVDLSDIVGNEKIPPSERDAKRKLRVEYEMSRIAGILKTLDGKDPATLSADEKKIYDLFESVQEDKKFHKAASGERLRSQTGIKDKFIQGIKWSGRYLGEMEKIFGKYKIPLEITRLAFVESMFNLEALSKVGASGIWQFMPSTGKLFLNMNSIVDERNDPIAATHGAAKHLLRDYEMLGTWPLAVNAYNTGPGRMRAAVNRMGTDIGKIIKHFDSAGYKFASRNFYPAFLAALDAFENRDKYFGHFEMEKPLEFDTVTTPFPIMLPELTAYTGQPVEKLALLNPHLQENVTRGKTPLPAGFSLRVPTDQGENFLIAANEINSQTQHAKWHVVESGENLKSIASKYNTNVRKLIDLNNISKGRVSPGQVIKLPAEIELAKENDTTVKD